MCLHLQDQKFLVMGVFGHGRIFPVTVWYVVALDVRQHLKLLQVEQQVELLAVVLHGQGAVQQGLPAMGAAHTHNKDDDDDAVSTIWDLRWMIF